MPSRRPTFHAVLAGCERGEADAWRAFLADYTPNISRLLGTYLPFGEDGARAQLWQSALRALVANNYARLREFDHQAEREFLMDLKSFVLEHAAQQSDTRHDSFGAPRPTIESVEKLVQKLPFLHQEIVLLKLAGYGDSALEKMLLLPGSVIQNVIAPVATEIAALGWEDASRAWPAAWLEVLREVRARRKPECPPHRICVRILDGQISWYEKTPAEEHITRCLHCLEGWVSLREIDYLRRDSAPLPSQEVEALLTVLRAGTFAEKRGSWLERMFGSGSRD